jgi:hypothetical protein
MPGRVIGGIGSPCSPSIAVALNGGKVDTPEWKPLFDGFRPIAAWLEAQKPDLLIVVGGDPAVTTSFNRCPAFTVGTAPVHKLLDLGGAKWPFGPLTGQSEFALYLCRSLIDDEFDIALGHDLPLDHGFLTALACVFPPGQRWVVPVVPIAINVLQPPLPTALRCFKLGKAIRDAVARYPKDIRVVVLAAGGLSYQAASDDWGRGFLDLVERDPAQLTQMTHQEMTTRGGVSAVEALTWMTMRGTLSDRLRCLHRSYLKLSNSGFGQLILEETDAGR